MRRGLQVIGLVPLMVAGTWLVGWWAVPMVAVLWRLMRRQEPAWVAGVAASVGWGVLLLLIPLAPLGRLTLRLGGLFHLPPWGAVGLALGYAALLGWSSARVAGAVADSPQGTRIAKVTTAPPGSRTENSSIP